MGRMILVTGGARSGKSSYAERLALSLAERPVYVATARVWDEEFRQRVERHRERRGPRWTNVEEERALADHDFTGRVVVVDCLTLWCTNFFYDHDGDTDTAREDAKREFDRLARQDAVFILVTNEIGMGGTSANDLQRRFTDMLGWMNQHAAARADEVVLMVAGIPVTIKKN